MTSERRADSAPLDESGRPQSPPCPDAAASATADDRRTARNLSTLVVYDVVIRIGWIFKTESVIMPAFLDLVAGAGWIRGCLLVVNRFGQSIPPAFFSQRLQGMRLKRRALRWWTVAMGTPFLVLAAVWAVVGSAPPHWMAGLFLALYFAFSCCHGVNQLSYSTLQGKLIPTRLRGRLLALSLPLGSGLAIVFAWWLMGDWLQRADGGFTYIFGFTGLCFVLGAVLTNFVDEEPDAKPLVARRVAHPFAEAWDVLRTDRNFRRLAAVVMPAMIGTVLFPHYQAMAREELGLTGGNLMIWVVVQNASVGGFGLLLGWIVHHRGERLGLRMTIFAGAAAPLTALAVVLLERDQGAAWYWLVFIPLGMTPLALKTMVGYTLEIAPTHDHPRYLSTLSLCLAVPFCFSPLVGWAVDLFGFEYVFAGGAVLILVAGALTFRLVEPRHAATDAVEVPAVAGDA
jgi:hypothetical protein